jgi:NAD+ kinase
MTAPRLIGLVPHLARPEAAELARRAASLLEAAGVHVRVPASDAEMVGLQQWAVPDDAFAEGLSYAFSLGGDGTMLRTVALVCASHVPVVGINVGHLGYLASEQPADLDGVIRRVLSGDHRIEERMMLDVEVSARHRPSQHFAALNDAVLEKSNAGNTVRLGVSFNDVPFADYSADGVIVATPTGSTAYAFSVRGPIVSPLMRALVIVPISPHMLFDRSLVLDEHETVRLEVLDGRTSTLFIDGRDEGELPDGAVVTVRANPDPARLVTFGPRDFHGILKAKFGLPGPGTPGRERFGADRTGRDGEERRSGAR